MRLSDSKKRHIKNTILDDLYGKADQEIKERKSDIAKRNRELYLAPLMDIINKLPADMVPTQTRYLISIKYKHNPNSIMHDFDQQWEYRVDTPIVNPHDAPNTRYSVGYPAESKLLPELMPEAKTLIDDILTLQKEKNELYKFIDDSFNKYSGTIALRNIWPESLHKYLPAEPLKKPRRRKVAKALTVADAGDLLVPAGLNARLTTNLLEGK